MKFGKRLMAVETQQKFFQMCEEDGAGIQEMQNRLEELKENQDEIDGVNHYTISKIQEKIYNLAFCPSCGNNFLYDEYNEERYCPKCDE